MKLPTRKCCGCKETLPISEFSPNKEKPLGVGYRCRPCKALKAKEQRRRKPYTRKQLDEFKKRSAEWRKKNPEKPAQQKRAWKEKYPHKKAAGSARYRASKRKATPVWLTEEHHQQISDFYWLRDDLIATTGELYHVDHIVPLKGDNVCGLHVPWNLQVLPADINLSKKNRLENGTN